MTTILILAIDDDGVRAYRAIGAMKLREKYARLSKLSNVLLDGGVSRFEVAGVSIDVTRMPEAELPYERFKRQLRDNVKRREEIRDKEAQLYVDPDEYPKREV